MRYVALPPKVLLPLAGLLGIALLVLTVLVGKALIHRGAEELPPTGSERGPALAPPLTLHPQQASPPWNSLSAKDLEEAMEDREDPEDVLEFLRSRLEAYAQEKQPPLPVLSPSAPRSTLLPGAPTIPSQVEVPREPTIREVQLAAIRYAEVKPEKIRHWRTLAQLRNFIPRFTLSLDRDRDRTIASSTSAGKTTFTLGPEDESVSLDFGFTWDLANLVWDPAQTSIDVRSRLMVQLRQVILEEATRLYFERQRLLAEFEANPTDDPLLQRERALRLKELTAQLDALTGGLYTSDE